MEIVTWIYGDCDLAYARVAVTLHKHLKQIIENENSETEGL